MKKNRKLPDAVRKRLEAQREEMPSGWTTVRECPLGNVTHLLLRSGDQWAVEQVRVDLKRFDSAKDAHRHYMAGLVFDVWCALDARIRQDVEPYLPTLSQCVAALIEVGQVEAVLEGSQPPPDQPVS